MDLVPHAGIMRLYGLSLKRCFRRETTTERPTSLEPPVQPDIPFFVPESAMELPSPHVRREYLDHGCLAAPRSEVLVEPRQ
jgi:hypothetical protein